jgi:hypothetical protein
VTGGAFIGPLADFLASVDNAKLLKPYSCEQILSALERVSSA